MSESVDRLWQEKQIKDRRDPEKQISDLRPNGQIKDLGPEEDSENAEWLLVASLPDLVPRTAHFLLKADERP